MHPSRNQNACERCRRGYNRKDDNLVPSGDKEFVEFAGGKSYETRTPHRCSICGVSWYYVREGGAGGHGSSWLPEESL
jgi:ribosomal protein S14